MEYEEQRCGFNTTHQSTTTLAGREYECAAVNCELNGAVSALASTGSVLYAGGAFTTAGGRPALSLAQFFGGKWAPVAGGVRGSVYAIRLMALPPHLNKASTALAAAQLAANGEPWTLNPETLDPET